MAHTESADALLYLPRLRVTHVNAISSPLTWGFPSMGGILGFTHALERHLSQHFQDLEFDGVAVVCHDFKPHVYRSSAPFGDKVFGLDRHPVNQHGNPASLVEEGKAHMEISLLIEARGDDCLDAEREPEIIHQIQQRVPMMRLAGGKIIGSGVQSQVKAEFVSWPEEEQAKKAQSKRLLRRCLPGFTLINRADLFETELEQKQQAEADANGVDVLMDYSSLVFEAETQNTDQQGPVKWRQVNKHSGWIVPIPAGYEGITDCYNPGEVLNARSHEYPFQFVESIYTLGQWLSPHRVQTVEDLFWRYETELDHQRYCWTNRPNQYLLSIKSTKE